MEKTGKLLAGLFFWNSFHDSAFGLNHEDHSPKNVVFGSFTALFAPRQTLVWRWKPFHANHEMTSILLYFISEPPFCVNTFSKNV
uniref:hypothetical protein n=1 Tax=Enterocloster clostridioformis TaxID=1531 RepID=UPI0025A505B4|nr:hypothetical protein [Enterocloster clostridioformis]